MKENRCNNKNDNWFIAKKSQEVTKEYFDKWHDLSNDEKQVYEELSKVNATDKNGEVIQTVNAKAERFFSLIHLRYIWIQHIGNY